jgi:hypothetical protein
MCRFRFPVLLAAVLAGPAAWAATPPTQPEKGPGGSDYEAGNVVKRGVGLASAATYVFHAAGPAAAPRAVVVLFPSWGATNPMLYGGWIEHLARRGHLVLMPRYQEVNRTRPADATDKAGALLMDALKTLDDDAEARPDLKRIAYLGHLAGVPIALNLAAGAKAHDLPEPRLIFALMPGGISSDPKSRGIRLEDLSELSARTLLVTVSGDRDHLPTDRAGRRILNEASAIPANRKLFVRAASDSHGFPAITASLASPGSPKPEYDAAAIKLAPDPPRDPKQKGPVWRWSADMSLSGEQTMLAAQLANNAADALDYRAFWKTFDLALAAAFAGKDATFLKADPRLTDMGTWSDGWPVRRLSADIPKSEAPSEQQSQAGTRGKL